MFTIIVPEFQFQLARFVQSRKVGERKMSRREIIESDIE